MPQSFGSIHLHDIFSTKHRQPWLTDDITERLNGFVVGLARARKCTLTKMGGIADHVHLLVQSARDIAPSDFMADIKALSSGWIHTEFPKLQDFGWQLGYGVFSVSYSAIETVKNYIKIKLNITRRRRFRKSSGSC